jgi:hypothetical protein
MTGTMWTLESRPTGGRSERGRKHSHQVEPPALAWPMSRRQLMREERLDVAVR